MRTACAAFLRSLAGDPRSEGDLNDFESAVVAEALDLKLVRIVAAGPGKNLRLTAAGKRRAADPTGAK